MMMTILLGLVVLVLVILVARFAAARIVLCPKAKNTPRTGEKWEFFAHDNGPWPENRFPPVTISDVRDGWVRYDMSTLRDQRLKLDSFVRMYRKVDA